MATQKERAKLQHSSLFSGNTVQSAGKLLIKDKKIVKVMLESGHYKPEKDHGKNLWDFLKEKLGKHSANKLPIVPYKH